MSHPSQRDWLGKLIAAINAITNPIPPCAPHALADNPDGAICLGQPHAPSGDQSEFMKLARAL